MSVIASAFSTERLFSVICAQSVTNELRMCTEYISVPMLSAECNQTKYRIRKHIDELRKSGLVRSGYESCYSDWNEKFYIVRGFCLTRAGKETDEYKRAVKFEIGLLEECFGQKEATHV